MRLKKWDGLYIWYPHQNVGALPYFFFVFSRQIHWTTIYYTFHFHAKVKHYTFILFVQVDYLQVLAICNHYKFVFFLYVLFPFFCPDIRQLLKNKRACICNNIHIHARYIISNILYNLFYFLYFKFSAAIGANKIVIICFCRCFFFYLLNKFR